MKIKEYKLYKTAKKTAKENNLEHIDSFEAGKRNILFDFSLLDSTDELTDDEKQYIRDHALRYVYASNYEQFYGKEFDDFTVCDGRALYYPHKVYDEHGCERRYVIMQLAKIIHTTDIKVSRSDFVKMHDMAVNEMFETNSEENDVYGHNITVHWHGMYCSCSDGATPSNYIIPAIVDCDNELDWEE